MNTVAGTSGQILMKDASNNPVWGDYSKYNNVVVFDCNGVAASPNINNCNPNWQVPAGITTILVECWGGGGGGCNLSGGGGGGYISAELTVVPLSNPTMQIGAGGSFGSINSNGIIGGTTVFTTAGNTYSISAFGGEGGKFGDPFILNGSNHSASGGGGFSAVNLVNKYYGLYGSTGGYSKLDFKQVSTTEFGKVVQYGDGGDTPLHQGSGGKGGWRISTVANNYYVLASTLGIQNGGGGGSDYTYGYNGRGGRIIIRY